MIKKITGNDYLRRYDNMSLTEQQEYLAQVQAWQEKEAPSLLRHMADPNSGYQNVMQCSAAWNDAECEAFQHGVILLTAFAHEPDSWLPEMIYVKTAIRVIRWIVAELNNRLQTTSTITSTGTSTSTITKTSAIRPQTSDIEEVPNDQTTKQPNDQTSKPAPKTRIPKNQTSPLPRSEGAGAGLRPVRPKHIDQYVHLLPKETQERAALVKELLKQMDVARENARLLMNDPKSSPDDRAKWASLATKCDKEVRAIYKELDREWDKLVKSGKVMVDDLGNARIIDGNDNVNVNDNNNPEPLTLHHEPEVNPEPLTLHHEPEVNPEPLTVNPESVNRRRQLRKWLVDTRRGNGDTRKDHVKKWKETFKEYVSIEGDAAYDDEKIIVAAKHYGIDIKKIKLRK